MVRQHYTAWSLRSLGSLKSLMSLQLPTCRPRAELRILVFIFRTRRAIL